MKLPYDVSSIDLDICDICNLGCLYCFHEDMTGHYATEYFMDKVISVLSSDQKKINFFGGEPLLAKKQIQYFIDKSKHLGLNYGLTSNLTKLDEETKKFIQDNKIILHCSIDGSPPVQDSQRITKGGGPTSHLIEKNVKLALEANSNDTCRMTITKKNIGYYFESVKYVLETLGFKKCAPVLVPEEGWTFEDLTVFETQMKQTCDWLFERLLEGVWYQVKFVKDNSPDSKRRHDKMCGAGQNTIAIGLGGDIYPCHRFTRSDSRGMMWLSNIYQENWLETFLTRRHLVNSLHKNDFEMCLLCPAYNNCNGGCPHINFTTGSDAGIELKNKHLPPYTYCEIKRREFRWGNYLWRKIEAYKHTQKQSQYHYIQPGVKPPQKAGKEAPKDIREVMSLTAEERENIMKNQYNIREKLLQKNCCG